MKQIIIVNVQKVRNLMKTGIRLLWDIFYQYQIIYSYALPSGRLHSTDKVQMERIRTYEVELKKNGNYCQAIADILTKLL